jgi:hypothetical protein
MRKRIIDQSHPAPTAREPGELDLTAIATALVTSEAPDHPVENAFDGTAGAGGSRWLAAAPGEQTLILQFDAPQLIRRIHLEVQEHDAARTQELAVSVSSDGGRAYRELFRQEYNFSPPHTTCEREDWSTTAAGTTHLRLSIKPDKGGGPCRATVTSLRVW